MKTLKLILILLLFNMVSIVQAQELDTKLDIQRSKVQEIFIPDLVVLSTSVIEAFEDIPKHVLVQGYTMPSNYFQMRFPIDNWNGKQFLSGCGLGCGTLPVDISGNLKTALKRNYATATMNTGHWAPSIREFKWALDNPQAEEDFAFRAVHETTSAGKQLIKAFYGRETDLAYFWGCSTGGRQAVVAASKYPKDFDGVISEAPVLNWYDVIKLHAWLHQTNTGPDGKEILTKEDLSTFGKAVYSACDEMDGKKDGLIANPSKCQFDPSILLCEDAANCLSAEKVEVLKKWHQGPMNEKEEPLFSSSIPLGSEPFWAFWFLGNSNEPHDGFIPTEGMLKYLFFQNDPENSYSLFDFDINSIFEGKLKIDDLLNAFPLSLKAFKEEGGKLLLFHGMTDPVIPYQFSVDYFNRNSMEFGNETSDFFRMFLIPGMDHCSAFGNLGITENSVDPLTALEKWVEKNDSPQELPVTQYTNDGSVKSQFSVPLYSVDNQ